MRTYILVAVTGCGADTLLWDEPATIEPAPTSPVAPGPSDPSVDDTGWEWPADVGIRVCADGSEAHTDLQAAIDVSAPGDHIGVCPGTWGPIEVPWSFDVRITGVAGPSRTTIDGGGGPAVIVRDGALELAGFRVTGTGVDDPWYPEGGAFSVHEADVTLRDCVIDGTTGPFALLFDENVLVMEDVVWENNTSDILWFLFEGDEATITRNTVRGGTHESVVTTVDLDRLTLTNSVFSDLEIDRAVSAFSFDSNGEGPLRVTNNVFYDVDDLEPWGGRVFSSDADFRNNIVVGCDAWNLYPMASSFGMFWDNDVDYEAVLTGSGNQFVDPRLVDPEAGDFHLRPDSPGIDAGDPGGLYLDQDGTRNDIGRFGGH